MIVSAIFPRFAMISIVALAASFVPALSVAASAEDDATEARRKEVADAYRNEVVPFLKTYCIECHGDKKKKGGLDFTKLFKRPEAGEFRHQWKLSLTNVGEHEMPPLDAQKLPTDEERRKF